MSKKGLLNPHAPSFVPRKLVQDSATVPTEEKKETPLPNSSKLNKNLLATSPPCDGVSHPDRVLDEEKEEFAEYMLNCMRTADLIAGPDIKNLVRLNDINY